MDCSLVVNDDISSQYQETMIVQKTVQSWRLSCSNTGQFEISHSTPFEKFQEILKYLHGNNQSLEIDSHIVSCEFISSFTWLFFFFLFFLLFHQSCMLSPTDSHLHLRTNNKHGHEFHGQIWA